MPASPPGRSREPIRSQFASDPDFRELLELFVGSAREKRAALEASFAAGDTDRLRTLAHQLKGAGAGYGFVELSSLAAALEIACRATDEAAVRATLAALVRHLDGLVV